jgi:RimJ/RimL family protein N-acetyltransferase
VAGDHDWLTVRPVRNDDLEDAAGVAAVLNSVIAEGRYTALAGHWTAEAELAFLQSLGPRSRVFVAEIGAQSGGRIVGFQVIEPFVSYTSTMDHVAHLGTYVLRDYRGRGIGRRLAEVTLAFARSQDYEKAVIYVLAHNEGGLAYYGGLGFEPRGTLVHQAKIDGVYYDEVVMEMDWGSGDDGGAGDSRESRDPEGEAQRPGRDCWSGAEGYPLAGRDR